MSGKTPRNPTFLPGALEEIMRRQGVTQAWPRRDGPYGAAVPDVARPLGAEVIPLLAGADRNQERSDPHHELDMRRISTRCLPFGFGLYYRLGTVLAHKEAREIVAGLLCEMPDLPIAAEVTSGDFSLPGPTSSAVTC